MKFYFCETCGKRLTEFDLNEGRARNKQLKGVYCTDCAIGVMTMENVPLSTEQARKLLEKNEPLPPLQATEESHGPRKTRSVAAPSAAQKQRRTSSGTSTQFYWIAGAAGFVLVGIALLFAGGPRPAMVAKAPPQEAPPTIPGPDATVARPVDARPVPASQKAAPATKPASEAIRIAPFVAPTAVKSTIADRPAEPPAAATPAKTLPLTVHEKVVQAPVKDVLGLDGESRVEYERVLNEAYTRLLGGNPRSAAELFTNSRNDPKFAALQIILDLDLDCIKYAEEIDQAVIKGATMLSDKRAFLLKKVDGKELRVGSGSHVTVKEIKNGQLKLEQDIGGGQITTTLPLEQLSAPARMELAKLSPPAPHANLKFAFVALANVKMGSKEFTSKMVRELLNDAQREQAPADKVAHIESHLKWIDEEADARNAWKSIETALARKRWEEARKELELFKQERGKTIFAVHQRESVTQALAGIAFQLAPPAPALWSSYFVADKDGPKNKYTVFTLGRPAGKLAVPFGETIPAPKMSQFNFGIQFRGILRIAEAKKYRFYAKADDRLTLTIDGKVVVKCVNNVQEADVELTRGDHAIHIDFAQDGGDWGYAVKWCPLGAEAWYDIPAGMLWHEPREIENYQKPE